MLLGACGVMDKIAPGREKVDYKQSRTTESLEVPPELSSATINDAPQSLEAASASVSGHGKPADSREQDRVLAGAANVALERDGDQQWLVVRAAPDTVWNQVREFWLQQGLLIRMENPQLGILETDWVENRADIPQGFIRSAIGKVLDGAYSAPTRDKFRVRLEAGRADGTTELFLTHRGVQEVVRGSVEDNSAVWQLRPSDPELEAEMLKRIMVFMGVEEQRAASMLAASQERPVLAVLVTDGDGVMLRVRQDFSRTWRRTGVALDRTGFAVEDRDRSNGVYYVKYNDPLGEQEEKGILDKLAFWSGDEADATAYQIELQADGAETRIIVRDGEGRRDSSSTARRILTLLEEKLK